LAIALPDLRSRLLGWFMVFALKPLDDTGKLEALHRRAHNRGLEIADEVVQYVLKRYPRDMHALFDLIEKIDSASLAQQRRITIPFLRSLDDKPAD
jgi:DnaA family protein